MVRASCPRSVLIMFQTHLKESVATFSFNLTSNIEKLMIRIHYEEPVSL